MGPDYSQTVNGYSVKGDIDRLYVQAKPGSGMAGRCRLRRSWNRKRGRRGPDVLFRVDCRATLTATGTESRIVGVMPAR